MTVEIHQEAVPTEDPQLTAARAAVRREAQARAGVYTTPAIEAAAALLVDLHTAGARHGITPEEWGWVTNLAGACIDVTADQLHGEKHVQHQVAAAGADSAAGYAVHLVDLLHAHLTDVRGVENTHRPGPYGITFTTCGRKRRTVQCAADGWHYMVEGGGPVASVFAPYDEQGAIAVADVVADLVAGVLPDPLVR